MSDSIARRRILEVISESIRDFGLTYPFLSAQAKMTSGRHMGLTKHQPTPPLIASASAPNVSPAEADVWI